MSLTCNLNRNKNIWLLFAAFFFLMSTISYSQIGSKEIARKQWLKMIHYQGLDGKMPETDLNALTEYKLIIDDKQKPASERENAGKQIAILILKAFGKDTIGSGALIERTVKTVVKDNEPVIINMDYPSTPLGQLAEVVQIGNGPVPLILIPEYRKNWMVYKEFMEMNKDKFTMYAVTLPGYNNTKPYPLPEFADYSKQVWLNSVTDGIIDLIKKKKLNKPYLVGSLNAGSYISVKLAAKNPELISGFILLNGSTYNRFIFSKATPGKKPTPEERINLVVADPSNILWPILQRGTLSRDSVEVRLNKQLARNHIINIYTRDSVRVKRIYEMHLSFRPFLERYDQEWSTADLTDDLKKLKVPILAAVSIVDEAYPFNSNTISPVAWQSFKLDNPSVSLQVVPFYDCRELIAMDAPSELGNAINAFVNGSHITGSPKKIFANRASPSAKTEQVLGTGSITISYSRPQVKAREIWGKLVPYDKVWRAGANEITEITFTSKVKLQDKELPAGSYSFFVIPVASGEWTVILNRVNKQWGAFRYNQEFDAIRFAVSPIQTGHQEWLSYSFENIKDNTAELWLRWEKMLVPVRIEVMK
jgi:pimeloyl-ACP methyl ester carboxylesterase